MDIQTRKIAFIKSFLSLQSEEVVSKFEQLLEKVQMNGTNEDLKPFTAKELNQRIQISEQNLKEGKFKTTSELLLKYKV